MHGINCPIQQLLFEPLIITRGSGYNRGLRSNRGTTGPPELGRSALYLVCRGSGSGRGTKISLRLNTATAPTTVAAVRVNGEVWQI